MILMRALALPAPDALVSIMGMMWAPNPLTAKGSLSMRPALRNVAAAACAAFVHVAASAAGVELSPADRPKYEEATNLIQTWTGSGDQLQRAFAILAGIAERNPRSASPLAALAELKYRLYTSNQGLAGEVVQLADRAVKLDPENADAQVIYSKIMLDQRQVNAAVQAAQQAIRLAPNKPEAMFQMASVARHAKRYDEAETWYRKAIDRHTHKQRRSNIYYHLADMLSKLEPVDVAKTAAAYESAADLAEGSFQIPNDAAVFLMNNTEHYDRAIELTMKALSAADYSIGRQNLGLLQYYKWGHATLHPDRYRDAKEKPWDPEKITAVTGITKEDAFAVNPLVSGTPYATLAMLKLGMIKDVDAFPRDCECRQDNALIASAHSNNLDMVKLLAAKGANVNVADPRYGNTALFYAVRFQNLEMVRFLVDHGSRINLQDKRGNLLVEYAIADAKPHDARVLQLLLEKGGDAEAVNAKGSPLAAIAVMQGKPAALALLLSKYKADPNTRLGGDRGDPLLALAALNTHADGNEMVKMLLDAGANPWVKARGVDVMQSLARSKEYYPISGDMPPKIRAAHEAMLRASDATVAMLKQARLKTAKPAGF